MQFLIVSWQNEPKFLQRFQSFLSQSRPNRGPFGTSVSAPGTEAAPFRAHGRRYSVSVTGSYRAERGDGSRC